MLKRMTCWSLVIFLSISCQENNTENEIEKSDVQVYHPRVVWTEYPAEHAIISWTTDAAGKKHHVAYSDKPVPEGKRMPYSTKSDKDGKVSRSNKDIQLGLPEAFYHHAELSDLTPNTKYFFRVCSDNNCSKTFYFKTAPAEGTGFSILFGGDSRVDTYEQYAGSEPHTDRQKMNKMIANLAQQDSSILAFVHGADFCMTADWRHLYWWFEDYMHTYGKDGKMIPLVVSRGNHDMEIGFKEHFWLGKVSRELPDAYYFSTRFSKDVSLITLNTEISILGDQLQWLESSLKTLRPKRKWLFVQYHKPAFPAVKSFGHEEYQRIRDHWVPLFERYNIDLAVESDGHALKKTIPIRRLAYSEDGIIYIGEGGLGVPQRATQPRRWYFDHPDAYAEQNHHVWRLSISEGETEVSAIGVNGKVLRQFTLERR